MAEQIDAEIVSSPQAPQPQIEEEPTPPQPEPEPEPEPEPLQAQAELAEVETAISHDPADGKYLVSITTRHPDPTKVAVNGRLVWEGIG